MVEQLNGDPTGVWCEFNHGGSITQRQVAHLLDAFEIHPGPLHPTRRRDFARRGYRLEQFTEAFAQFLPRDPIIRSPAKRRKRAKPAKAKAAKKPAASDRMIGSKGVS